ncbi:dihydropteroate synthase [Paenisporosarcina antarctica]|uniref:Dihydropteroate synthase n=1 Tax=Paenisporosarcina antarctica TaxID=417367 RepID=A0A4P7A2B8_9BACL|nr:dihydropteroate synthase [Paenisporosarcina antarctica]QBP42997.1 dihydropteroate synthase [Paenisporosarcina antarctica]
MNLINYTKPFEVNGTVFDFHKETIVMGILNVTPDSFSDGGRYDAVEAAVIHAKKMVADGAKIIDVGGESTRPGHVAVGLEEELSRVIPVIRALSRELDVAISIDTYKEKVAEAAILAGAHIINDVWGAKREPAIAEVAARLGVPILLMHNRDNMDYTDFLPEVSKGLEESVQIAKDAGVPTHHIWLDPGIGFAKTTQQNILMMQHVQDVVDMGYPVLLGTSRKSTIGKVLNLPVEERLEGTAATVSFGIMHGCHMMRVHDVKEIVRTVRMMDVLVGKQLYIE